MKVKTRLITSFIGSVLIAVLIIAVPMLIVQRHTLTKNITELSDAKLSMVYADMDVTSVIH